MSNSCLSSAVVEGSGTPILLLHGGPGLSAETLAPVARLLRNDFQVVAYDQLGTQTPGLSVARLIQQIEDLRRRLGLETLVLLGHSWGAALACLYAATYKERTAALVLVHPMEVSSNHLAVTQLEWERRRPWRDRLRTWAIQREIARRRCDAARRNALEAEQLLLDFRLTCADAPKGSALHDLSFMGYDWQAAERLWKDLERRWPGADEGSYDLCPVFRSIEAPVQVIVGARDVIDPQSSRQIAELTQGEYLCLQRSGHWSFLEQPREFKASVCSFLQQVHRGSRHSVPLQETKPLKASAAGVR